MARRYLPTLSPVVLTMSKLRSGLPMAGHSMDRLDRAAYVRRIDYYGSLEPTLETLRALPRAHMIAVPFENLDIREGRALVLDEVGLFDKIVHRRRGGFCYELNGLFAALL